MKRGQLYVEHRYKGRFLGAMKYEAGHPAIYLGSGRNTHLRLVGDEVAGVHAVIESKDSEWQVSDLGSISGTWVDKSSIVEHKISKDTNIKIGDHELRLMPKAPHRELFKENAAGGSHQQIVIRFHGTVIQSHILPRDQSYDVIVGDEKIHLDGLKGQESQRKTFGRVEVLQRPVNVPEQVEKEKFELTEERKISLGTVATGILMIFVMIGIHKFYNSGNEQKPEENQYTKMIYDAKVVKEKRTRAMAISKQAFGNIQQPQKPPEVTPKDLGVSTKVISKIKASGLSQLIGKIAKRAGKATDIVVTQSGNAASPANHQTATTVGGGATGAAVKNSGTGYKIAGVGTSGKAGGGAYKEGTGMASGTTGNAEVGVVEEETIVDGGLDREVIAAIIKENLGQIRYCYERQLSASPDLYGKVAVRFVIGSAGDVTSQQIGATTLNNAMVEGCILRRVARWKFPNPKGGTSVIVTYPFLFKSLN
jgi:outer membrane biosynthesis protein TonB